MQFQGKLHKLQSNSFPLFTPESFLHNIIPVKILI